MTETPRTSEYPAGLRPGDFIQTDDHFGDVYFEVVRCYAPDDSRYWSIQYVTYDKYAATPRIVWVNSASRIRKVVPAEMAVPGFIYKRERYQALAGQYDPVYGFAPQGTPMRVRNC